MIEILISALGIWLLIKTIRLAFKITWCAAKIVATILIVFAIPVFIVCLLFAGSFFLLIPVALIAGASILLEFFT